MSLPLLGPPSKTKQILQFHFYDKVNVKNTLFLILFLKITKFYESDHIWLLLVHNALIFLILEYNVNKYVLIKMYIKLKDEDDYESYLH